jgi:L-glyceraldehyde 3-phosphate reductase
LTGKYDSAAATGRLAGALDDPGRRAALDAGRALRSLAEEWGASAAALAVAFVLDNPLLASVLIGATSPAQLDEVVAGVALHDQLSDDDRARLRGLVG